MENNGRRLRLLENVEILPTGPTGGRCPRDLIRPEVTAFAASGAGRSPRRSQACPRCRAGPSVVDDHERDRLAGVDGIAIGVPLALAATQVVKSLLFGLQANDPLTLAGTELLLLLVSLAAGYLPARRASIRRWRCGMSEVGENDEGGPQQDVKYGGEIAAKEGSPVTRHFNPGRTLVE